MKHNLLTAPVTEPVSLTDLKTYLGISVDETVMDAFIENVVIPSTRKKIERYLGKSLVTQTWLLTMDYFPNEIYLEKQPVQSISSIKYYDAGSSLQTIAVENYYLDNRGEEHWILPVNGYSWPSTNRANAVEVTYVAGNDVADIDEEVKHCIYLLAGFYINTSSAAESGMSDTRQANWILRDTIGHLREISI